METQIFYWTGVVIWWGLCAMCAGGIVAGVIIAPLVSYHNAKKVLWQWRWAAITAETGFTHNDVAFAMAGVKPPKGVDVVEMMAWVEGVKERGRVIRDRKP